MSNQCFILRAWKKRVQKHEAFINHFEAAIGRDPCVECLSLSMCDHHAHSRVHALCPLLYTVTHLVSQYILSLKHPETIRLKPEISESDIDLFVVHVPASLPSFPPDGAWRHAMVVRYTLERKDEYRWYLYADYFHIYIIIRVALINEITCIARFRAVLPDCYHQLQYCRHDSVVVSVVDSQSIGR